MERHCGMVSRGSQGEIPGEAGSSDPVHDEGDASGEQSTAGDSQHEIRGALVPADQVLNPSLNHQHRQRHRRARQKPPGKCLHAVALSCANLAESPWIVKPT